MLFTLINQSPQSGKELRQQILKSKSVVLDFKGVRILYNKWINEAIVKTLNALGPEEFSKRVSLINLSDYCLNQINKSISHGVLS